MNWITIIDSVLFVVFYLVLACGSAYRIASYESAWAIKVSNTVRAALLIFCFNRAKISIMAVV